MNKIAAIFRNQKASNFHEGERTLLRQRLFRRFRDITCGNVIRRSMQRQRQWRETLRTPHPAMDKVPVFVLGCQRSGTTMLCKLLAKSPHAWDYQESHCSVAFQGCYLRPEWVIKSLIRITPAPIVSFKSILDSQSAQRLLSRFHGARAIWVYRRYQDVANSCARKPWAGNLKTLVRWVSLGETDKLGARGAHISPATEALFATLFHERLSHFECACLYWYLRNQLYFDLNLSADERVLLVQYEDLVAHPQPTVARIFEFLGVPYEPSAIDGIFDSSVGRHSAPKINPAINSVCQKLQRQLDLEYSDAREGTQIRDAIQT